MKFPPFLFGCVAIMVTMSGAFAVEPPSTNAPPVAPAPAKDQKPGMQAAAKAKPGAATKLSPATASAPAVPESKLDSYLKELGDSLKLTDEEKKDIETYYLADGVLLKNILNNDALSPLQQDQQVSDLHEARNAKIKALLQDGDRQQAFFKVEAKYRVALTEVAAEGGLVPAPAPPVSTPAPSSPAPATASSGTAPVPVDKTPGEKPPAK